MNKKILDQKYFYLGNACLILICALAFFVSLGLSGGKSFLGIFFLRGNDVLMDFTNSIRDSNVPEVYSELESLYPPIVVLFFRFLALFYPKRVLDLSVDKYEMWKQPMVYIQFFLIVVISFALIGFAINRKFRHKSVRFRLIIYFFIALSYPVLYAIERGNIILLSAALLIAFICLYQDEKRWIREVSYILLALSISVKLYPFVFGLLLFKNGDFWGLLKTAIYSIIFTLLPFIFFGGIPTFMHWITHAFSYFGGGIPSQNSNMQLILYHMHILPSSSGIFDYINYIFMVIFWIYALFCKKQHIASICLGLSVLAFSGATSTYGYLFLIPGFILGLDEEKYDFIDISIYVLLTFTLVVCGFYRNNFQITAFCEIQLVVMLLIYILIFIDIVYAVMDVFKNRQKNKEVMA